MAPSTKPASGSTASNHAPPKNTQSAGVLTENNIPGGASVNRKKQKRRQKQAARQTVPQEPQRGNQDLGYDDSDRDLAPRDDDMPLQSAQGRQGGLAAPYPAGQAHSHSSMQRQDALDEQADYDDDYSDEMSYPPHPVLNGSSGDQKNKRKKKKKATGKSSPYDPARSNAAMYDPHTSFAHTPPPPPPPPISDEALRTVQRKVNKDPIWNESDGEERLRIKEFWLSLSEEDRKSLVKIEKEAVLRKMKEQQKHSCSCTVCGRKRTAIEEELEVLYDAYYEELEQYANHSQQLSSNGTPILPPTRPHPHSTTRITPSHLPPVLSGQRTSRGRITELPDDEDDLEDEEGDEEEYSDDDDDYDDEDYSEDTDDLHHSNPATDFFTFGNSLTVKGGILTVADDLLKNDGQKFIDMMEQLAERRMQREDIGGYPPYGMSHPSMATPHPHDNHTHLPPEEDEYDDEEDDDYDSQDEEDYEDDEMDTMTEEQRMEEGRRMFQIFAARMFEQRVLNAYREKVSYERSQKLIEEIEAEEAANNQQNAKKSANAEKKKAKKQAQKQAKAEEKAKKDQQKAAEEAAAREKEEKQKEEQRRKREEQKKKKEAERKAIEEEKQKKEAEKMKRLETERRRQEDIERRAREQKAEEKKKKDDAKRKEREEREAAEKEARDKKAQEDKDRQDREDRERAEREVKEQKSRDEQAQAASTTLQPQSNDAQKRPSLPAIVALPPALKSRNSTGPASPQTKVATPVIPKAPTPVKNRDVSTSQAPQTSAPQTPETTSQSKHSTPPRSSTLASSVPSTRTPSSHAPPMSYVSQPSPMHTIAPPPGMPHPQPSNFPGMPPIGPGGYPPSSQGPMMHGLNQRMASGQQMPIMTPSQPRPYGPHGTGMPPPSRGFVPEVAPGFHAPGAPGSGSMSGLPTHTRQQSGTYERSTDLPPSTQPIQRPAPIKRPASVKPSDGGSPSNADVDDLSNHLGSSALLDDNDEPLPSGPPDHRRPSAAPGMPASGNAGFGSSSPFDNPPGPFSMGHRQTSTDNWRAHNANFGAPGMPNAVPTSAGGWGTSQPPFWSNHTFNSAAPASRPAPGSRPVRVRQLACKACQRLSTQSPVGNNNPINSGFHDLTDVLRTVDSLRDMGDLPVQFNELYNILDTEATQNNGGGSFIINNTPQGKVFIKWEPGVAPQGFGGFGSQPPPGVREIGSPTVGGAIPTLSGLGNVKGAGF